MVAIAGDAGGATAIGPVIRRLREEGRTVTALAYRQACNVWKREAIDFVEVSEHTTPAEATAMLQQLNPQRLLSATSWNGVDLEKRFITAANELRIPSLAVLDFWSNYRIRFSNDRGDMSVLPDLIAVMDDRALTAMVAEGFEPRRLRVTGQPAFDDLVRRRGAVSSGVRQRTRARLGVANDEKLVLFASDPIEQLYGADTSASRSPGYTEHTVLDALTASLDRIAEHHGARLCLLIRPHPREDASALLRHRGRVVRTLVSGEGDRHDLVVASDLVTGMTTVLLLEAVLLGCVVASLQPGARGVDPLPTNAWGASRAVYRPEEIEAVLTELLFDDTARAAAAERCAAVSISPGATERVVQLLESLT